MATRILTNQAQHAAESRLPGYLLGFMRLGGLHLLLSIADVMSLSRPGPKILAFIGHYQRRVSHQ